MRILILEEMSPLSPATLQSKLKKIQDQEQTNVLLMVRVIIDLGCSFIAIYHFCTSILRFYQFLDLSVLIVF